MQIIYILIILGALQIATSLLLVFDRKRLNFWKVVSFSIIIIYLVISLAPVKLEIDKQNDCIAYYSGIPSEFQTYDYNFLKECNFSEDSINKLRGFQVNPTIQYDDPIGPIRLEEISWAN